ncbi:unnamed protein product [Bathycoccus prasinos]
MAVKCSSSAGMNVFTLGNAWDGHKTAFQCLISSSSNPTRKAFSCKLGKLFVTPPSTQMLPSHTQNPGQVQPGMYPHAKTQLIKSSRECHSEMMTLCGVGNNLVTDKNTLPLHFLCASSGNNAFNKYLQYCPILVKL